MTLDDFRVLQSKETVALSDPSNLSSQCNLWSVTPSRQGPRPRTTKLRVSSSFRISQRFFISPQIDGLGRKLNAFNKISRSLSSTNVGSQRRSRVLCFPPSPAAKVPTDIHPPARRLFSIAPCTRLTQSNGKAVRREAEMPTTN